DAPGAFFVTPVAEGEQARGGAAEIDHHEKEGRQGVEPEMRAQPGQADRQDPRRAERGGGEERSAGSDEGDERDAERSAIDKRGGGALARQGKAGSTRCEQRRVAPEQDLESH